MRSPVHLRESRKHHLADPSLAAAALGATPEALLGDFKTLGLLFESLALHDLWVYARANGMGLYHYHDARDLEVDAVVARPGGTWVPVEVKLSSAQLDEASDNLVAVEERMVAAGNEPPAAKVAVIGYGSQAHVTERGVQVVPLDARAVGKAPEENQIRRRWGGAIRWERLAPPLLCRRRRSPHDCLVHATGWPLRCAASRGPTRPRTNLRCAPIGGGRRGPPLTPLRSGAALQGAKPRRRGAPPMALPARAR